MGVAGGGLAGLLSQGWSPVLFVVFDRALEEKGVATWVHTEMVRSAARVLGGDVGLGWDSPDPLASAEIVAAYSDAPNQRLGQTAAEAMGVVAVTTQPPVGIRKLLGLQGAGGRVELGVVMVTDEALDEAQIKIQVAASWVLSVSAEGTKRELRKIRRVRKWLAWKASEAHRLDEADGRKRRRGAVSAASEPFHELIALEGVEEIQIRGSQSMYVLWANGEREKRSSPFPTDADLLETLRTVASHGGAKKLFSPMRPMLDMQLAPRWRLHGEGFVSSPPNAVLRHNMGGTKTLQELGIADDVLLSLLVGAAAGDARANVVVASPPSGGKTTVVQCICGEVPESERIDTIEDTEELMLAEYGIHENTIARFTRDENQEGVAVYSMADHIRAAKRANSGKVVVGEIRGPGTEAMLDTFSSGWVGCLATIHSPPGAGMLQKLVQYATSEGATERYARRQIANGVDLLVWMGRNEQDQRVVADVTQVLGIDERSGLIRTRGLWKWKPGGRWAVPTARPEGRMADLYESVGVAL